MKNFNKIILIIVALVFTISTLTAQNMYVRQFNNTQTAYPISGIDKITFSTGYVNIHQSTGTNANYDMDSVRYIAFQVYTVGVNDFTEQNDRITLYPNPVENYFNIRLEAEVAQSCVIEIYTMEGRLVYSENGELSSNTHRINVSNLSQGTYLCKISNGKKVSTTKFVKL